MCWDAELGHRQLRAKETNLATGFTLKEEQPRDCY